MYRREDRAMSVFWNLAGRRSGVAAVVVLLGCAAVGIGGAGSSAQAAAGTGVSCSVTAQYPQFDDEPGGFGTAGDCVIAVPDRAVNGAAHAGAVEIDQTGAG